MPKKYTKEDLELAISKVKKGVSLRKAAALTNVPASTIKDHTRGKYVNKITKRGANFALTKAEEIALCNYIQYMGDRGFPLTRKLIKKLANDIVTESGRPSVFNSEKGPTFKWLREFLQRHKELSIRKPHGLERVRSEIQPHQIDGFYKLLDQTLTRLGIKDDPTRIFNLDETGFSSKLQGREKIVVLKGKKHPYQPFVSINGHVTVQVAISAEGKTVAPLLIYSKNLPRSNFTDGIPDHWSFDFSDSGFINNEILLSWFEKCFAKQCGKSRPILVIMDNHVTHLNKKVIELLCLPAHSTHLLKPLDIGYFHVFKQHFTNLSVALGYTGMKSVPRHKFPKLLHLAMNKISGSCISSAFSCIGICPFNKSKARFTSSLRERPVTSSHDESHPQKCATCGHVSTENQLVKLGLIPAELQSIMIDPPVDKEKKSSKRKLDTARVLTCFEIKKGRKDITESESPNTCKNTAAIECNVEELVENDVLCQVCMTGNEELTWIGCDNCERWVHYECVGCKQQRLIDASLKYKRQWLCNTCLQEE